MFHLHLSQGLDGQDTVVDSVENALHRFHQPMAIGLEGGCAQAAVHTA